MTCDGTIWIRPCDSGCEGVAGADSFYLGSAQDDAFIMTSAAFLLAPIFSCISFLIQISAFLYTFLHFLYILLFVRLLDDV